MTGRTVRRRVPPTLDVERSIAAGGVDAVVGFDEVGRGALAGPVMVGAAAMWADDVVSAQVPEGLTDSKLLTPRRRERFYNPLHSWCAAAAVEQASNREIDEWGISHALGVAALRALTDVEHALASQRQELLRMGAVLDGPYDYISKASGGAGAPDVPVCAEVTCRIKADQSCALVSAASVIAKVTRDALMVRLATSKPQYAGYEWEKNKGYGSAAHRAAIAKLGPSDLHRVSWHLT